MEAGAYLPRPVVVSMMLKTHMKRGFWPAAGRIALRASGGWLEDQSLRTVQVAGQLQHALLAARLGHDLDAGSQTEEYGQGVDVLRLQSTGSCVRWIPGGRAGFGQAELAKSQGSTGNLGRGLDGLNF